LAQPGPKRLVLFNEAFESRARSEPDDAMRLRALAESLGATGCVDVFEGQRDDWLHCYQQLQDGDIKAALGGWIAATHPRFGPSIAARFARLDALDPNEVARCRQRREPLRARLDALLEDAVLVLPTTPLALLAKDASPEVIDGFYTDALTMNSIAALGGLPQITMPFTDELDRPLALSIVGARGDDRALLALARQLFMRAGS
jgi:amidase